ncbi:IS91 family transposase [Acidobacteriota bacterium]
MKGWKLKVEVEVNDIFRKYGDLYKKTSRSLMWPIWPNQLKALRDIQQCRTSELGGHKEVCDTCGEIRISYNSCRNRHCPKCQSLPAEKWILERSDEILPIGHFHVVFTIPSALNTLIINNPHNQQVVYNILFKAASQTLLLLSRDKKFLGAKIGIIGILHTWGQNLMSHPHIHFLVTGGGLATSKKDKDKDDGDQCDQWVWARRTRKRKKKFLFPKDVVSKLFKGIFLSDLQENHLNGELKLKDADGDADKNFQGLIRSVNYKKWVVYCKPPMKNSSKVIEYFGRYTHRVAISNRRIIKLEDGRVFFKWKDYRDGNKIKIMSLEAAEFIRRFLLHILPERFVKIRYYGLYGNRNRKETIQRCQALLGVGITASPSETESQSNSQNKKWWEIIFERKGIDITLCPFCKVGHMHHKESLCCIDNGNGNTSAPIYTYTYNSRYNYNDYINMRGPPASAWGVRGLCLGNKDIEHREQREVS